LGKFGAGNTVKKKLMLFPICNIPFINFWFFGLWYAGKYVPMMPAAMPKDHDTQYDYNLIQQNCFLEFYYSVDVHVWQGKNGNRHENLRNCFVFYIGGSFNNTEINFGFSVL